jgi:uncharacterized protein with FMN-binding domain
MITARTSLVTLAGLSMIGALAGCTASDASTGNTSQGSRNDYVDGEYSASGSYVSPNGEETIDVTLSLEAGTVTAVEVTPNPTNPNTEMFQGQFASGIAAQVVGKSIDELNVDKVAGSSLTSGGFNDAIEQIKADAAA